MSSRVLRKTPALGELFVVLPTLVRPEESVDSTLGWPRTRPACVARRGPSAARTHWLGVVTEPAPVRVKNVCRACGALAADERKIRLAEPTLDGLGLVLVIGKLAAGQGKDYLDQTKPA